MKRFIYSFLFTLLLVAILPAIVSYADYGSLQPNETSTYPSTRLTSAGKTLTQIIDEFNAKYAAPSSSYYLNIQPYPYSITLSDGTVCWADADTYNWFGVIAYGGINGVTYVVNNFYSGVLASNDTRVDPANPGGGLQPRYLGLSINGDPITNWMFPLDSGDGDSEWEYTYSDGTKSRNWTQYPWNSRPPHLGTYDDYQNMPGADDMILAAVRAENIELNGFDLGWESSPFYNFHNLHQPSGTNSFEAKDYFTVVSPWTEYTTFECIGWQQLSGGWYYDSFSMPPSVPPTLKPNLKIEIIDKGYTSGTFDPSANYTAKVRVTLTDNRKWSTYTQTQKIKVDFSYMAGGSTTYPPFQEFSVSQLANNGDYLDFNYTWKANANENVVLTANVNSAKVVEEGTYTDNTATTTVQTGSTPPPDTGGWIFYTVDDSSTAANGDMTDKITAANVSLPDDLNRYLPGSEIAVRIHIDPAGVQYDRFQIKINLNATDNPEIEIINNTSRQK